VERAVAWSLRHYGRQAHETWGSFGANGALPPEEQICATRWPAEIANWHRPEVGDPWSSKSPTIAVVLYSNLEDSRLRVFKYLSRFKTIIIAFNPLIADSWTVGQLYSKCREQRQEVRA
jgi:hypothetical protein